jgi:hypothetical protein
MFPALPGWGDPIGLAFFLAGTGVFFWGLHYLMGSKK